MKLYTVIIVIIIVNLIVLYNYKHFDFLFAAKPVTKPVTTGGGASAPLGPCPSGQTKVNGVCKPSGPTGPTGPTGALAPCSKGQTRVNGVCKPTSGPQVSCSKGQVKVNGKCVSPGGGPTTTTNKNTAPLGPCPSGQIRANGKCILLGNLNRNRPCVKGEIKSKSGNFCYPDPKTASSSPAYNAGVNGMSWDKYVKTNPEMADNPGALHMFQYGLKAKNNHYFKNPTDAVSAASAYSAGKSGMTFTQFLSANPQAKNLPGVQQMFQDGVAERKPGSPSGPGSIQSSNPAFAAGVNGWSWEQFTKINPNLANSPGANEQYNLGQNYGKAALYVNSPISAYKAGQSGQSFSQYVAKNPLVANVPGIQKKFELGQEMAGINSAHGGSPYLNDPNFVGMESVPENIMGSLGAPPPVKPPPPPVIPQPHVPENPVKHFLGVPYRT